MANGTCTSCSKHRPIRKGFGICYYCHSKMERKNTAEFDAEDPHKHIREAYYALIAARASENLEREEEAAFDLIEAVENYLGKV